MKARFRFASFAASVALVLAIGGCATLTSGDHQEIFVTTNPPGATCELTRNGAYLATIQATPAGVRIEKTQADILITCKRPGYQTAQLTDHSGVNTATVGNVIAGGLIGWAVDNWTDADSRYHTPVFIQMVNN